MWSKEEVDILSELYPVKLASEIAEMLGKSRNAVNHKAMRMGLQLSDEVRKRRLSAGAAKLSSNQCGENNPNWKGGRSKTPYFYKVRQKERYPERVRARELAARALRSGKLQRKPCEVCGDQNSHMHHEDYTKPLEVVFLCPKHHRQRHCS